MSRSETGPKLLHYLCLLTLLHELNDIHISHKVNPIINTYSTNFLVLTLDSTLSWKTHIDS